MVEHQEHATGQALGAEGDGAERDEADLGQRGVGHQPLQVTLGAGDDGTVDDPDDGQGEQQRRQRLRGLGEQAEVEADDPVGAQLGQHAREQHRALLGRLRVGVGRPGVQREERRLDREGRREGQEEKDLRRRRQVRLHQRAEREGEVVELRLVDEGEGKDPDEQEGRAEERVEEELDRGVGPPLVPPTRDDEVGGHERQLEHEEEHDEVEGQEAPHHGGLEQEDPGEVDPAVLAVAPEDDGQREEHSGEQHQEDGDAVHPEVPVHARGWCRCTRGPRRAGTRRRAPSSPPWPTRR